MKMFTYGDGVKGERAMRMIDSEVESLLQVEWKLLARN